MEKQTKFIPERISDRLPLSTDQRDQGYYDWTPLCPSPLATSKNGFGVIHCKNRGVIAEINISDHMECDSEPYHVANMMSQAPALLKELIIAHELIENALSVMPAGVLDEWIRLNDCARLSMERSNRVEVLCRAMGENVIEVEDPDLY